VLTADVEDAPAGDQELDAGGTGELIRQVRCGVGDLLHVVEHDQHVCGCQRFAQPDAERGASAFLHPQGLGDRRNHERRLGDGSEFDVGHSVWISILRALGDGEREPGLADPTGAEEGHHPVLWVVEKLEDAGHILLATDQAGEWTRHPTSSTSRLLGPAGRCREALRE
jgi:hypothetical protein